MIKPNHVCKNKNCGREYYACDHCDRTEKYLRVACSPECYQAYAKQWLDAHPNVNINNVEFLMPIEIGKTYAETKAHMQKLMSKPIEQVETETKQELSDMGYAEEVETLGISGTVDLINTQLAEGLAEDEATANENVNDNIVGTKKNRRR